MGEEIYNPDLEDKAKVVEQSAAKAKPFEWNQETIKQGRANGTLDKEQATELYLKYKLSQNYYEMKPAEVRESYNRGLISQDQVGLYALRKKAPVTWWAGDISKGIATGIEEAFENTANIPVDLFNSIAAEGHKLGRVDLKIGDSDAVKDASESTLGKLTEGLTEFAIPFIPAGKLLSAVSFGRELMASGKVASLVTKYPKLAGFLTHATQSAAAGAVADFTFDPLDGNITDMLSELNILPESLQFLRTDPDDSLAYSRIKNTIEGLGLGLAADVIMFGLKSTKSALYLKFKGDYDAIAKEIKSVHPELVDDIHEGFTTPKTEIVEPAAFQEVKKDTERIFKKVKDGVEPEFSDNFIKKIEDAADAQKLIKTIFDENPYVKHVQTHEATQKLAEAELSKLGKLTGGNPVQIKKYFENEFKNMTVSDMTAKTHALNQFMVKYADEVALLARNSDGSTESVMKIMTHIKLVEEVQNMVYGVRSEAGRLLNSYNMKINKPRFDFSDLTKLGDVPADISDNIDKYRKIISNFGESKDAAETLKKARQLGRGGIHHWLLNFSQAAKLWSGVTHATNILSQTGAVAFRTAARLAGYGVMAGVKQDARYMKAFAKELGGIGHALKVCFEGGSRLTKVSKAEGMSFKEAVLKDEKIGNFYKALIGREGIIDSATKLDSIDSKVVSRLGRLGSHVDTILKLPFNALTGVDEVFKSIGTFSEYFGGLYKEGMDLGKHGADLDLYFKQAFDEGRPKLFNKALEAGREVTFQNRLTPTWSKLGEAMNAHWSGTMFRMLFAPFYTTTINIMKYPLKNSALGLLSKSVRENLAEGGVKMYETIARMTMGSAAMYYGWNLYQEGRLTGKHDNKMRDTLNAAGIQENSYKNDKGEWVSLERGNPFTLWLTSVANLAKAADVYDQYNNDPDIEKQFSDVFAALIAAPVDLVVGTTWMQGSKDFTDFLSNPEQYSLKRFKKMGLRQAEGLIPGGTLIDWTRQEFGEDNYIVEVNSMIDVLQKKLGSHKNMIKKRDPIFGDIIEREDKLLHFSNKRTESTDPVMMELIKNEVNVSPFRDWVHAGGVKTQLSAKELDQLEVVYSELNVRDILMGVMKGKSYQNSPSERRRIIIKRIISNARDMAKRKFLSKNDGVYDRIKVKMKLRAERLSEFHGSDDAAESLKHWYDSSK